MLSRNRSITPHERRQQQTLGSNRAFSYFETIHIVAE
jgi:hypothetical protein